MIVPSLRDYSDAYMLIKETINVAGVGTPVASRVKNREDKQAIFKNCAPFTNCIREINKRQVDNAKDLDVVMWLYNLIEYSDNYSKTSGNLYQFC